jgi:tetratricopeptide (TPR) repeat protein
MISPDGSQVTTSPEQHRRLKELVEAALELPAADRIQYLEGECDGDTCMLRQARELLDLYREEDDEPIPPPGELEQIGSYRLITELGAGGMGVVYLAQREDGFSRTVALKVIRRGMDTDFFLSRFHQEREILGALDHTGIVRIVDAGSTPDGRPYLVMDFVDGVRIDTFCEGLSIRARVSLFIKVCAAVQHAHRNLIVHRDLKPGNILVTADGQPKLLDFGIAKVLDQEDNEATNATIPIMTRQYASPEQVRGQRVNTSSDVYALGLILYELLSGTRPYDLKDMPVGEAERVICEIDPPEPSKLAPKAYASQLRGDLDRILLMAIRKEPERRYPSVEALSMDLEKYLQGQPVSAQRDTVAYRASKFIQRNLASVAVGSAMFVLLAGGITSTLWQARIAGLERARAEREAALAKTNEVEAKRQELRAQESARAALTEKDRAEQKAQEAERQRQKAEERFRDLRSMANSLLFDFHGMIRNLPGATDARKLLITKSLEQLELLNREAAGDPSLQAEVAAAYEQLGQLQGAAGDAALGDTKGAFDSQVKALEIRQRLAAAHPGDAAMQRDLAASSLRMAELLQALKQPLVALQRARQAEAAYDALVKANPKDTLSLLGLAAAEQAAGQALESAGRLQDAMQAYAKHTETRRRIEATSPRDIELQAQTAEARDLEARALEIEGRFAAALRIVQETGVIHRRAAEASPNNLRARRNVIQNHQTIAALAERVGELSSALENYQRALTLMGGLVTADPHNTRLLEDHAALRAGYATTLFRMGRTSESVQEYRSTIQAASELVESDPDNPAIRATLASAYQGMGQALMDSNKSREAKEAFDQAISLFDDLAATSPRDITIQMNRALAHIGAGRILRDSDVLGEAELQFRQAVTILERILPGSRDHRVLSNLGIAYNRLGDVYRLEGKSALALATYKRTESIVTMLLNRDPRNAIALTIRAESLSRSGLIHEQLRDWPAALQSFQSAAEFDAKQQARDPNDLRAKSNLAVSNFRICEIRFRLLQYQAAFDSCQSAIARWREVKNTDAVASGLTLAGDIRLAQADEDGRKDFRSEACQLYRDATAINPKSADLKQRLERCIQ